MSGSDEKKLKRQKMIEKLLVKYLDELPDQLNEVELLLLDFNEAGFDRIFQIIHSMKGSSGTFGLNIVSKVCHQMESFLASARDNLEDVDSRFIDHALAYLDVLSSAVQDHLNGENDEDAINKRLLQLGKSKIDEKDVNNQ